MIQLNVTLQQLTRNSDWYERVLRWYVRHMGLARERNLVESYVACGDCYAESIEEHLNYTITLSSALVLQCLLLEFCSLDCFINLEILSLLLIILWYGIIFLI